ncbi:MAG: ABC transporter ATP-binding protein [Actinomycetota bacterium]
MLASVKADPVVRCVAATRRFGVEPASVTALSEVSCTVEPGAQIVITGPSGSGKSTLLNLMAGLDMPTSGHIEWPAIGSSDSLRPGPVAVVFQGPSLVRTLTVLENVALARVLDGDEVDEATSSAMRSLESLGLEEVADKLPDEISGGQAQRVAVARALAGRPRLILADEPTGQLDRSSATAVIEALRASAREAGAALVVTTHDPLVAEHFAARWAMADGILTEMEAPAWAC